MREVLVRIDGLGVRYADSADAALQDVSLDLMRGERLAIVGESGSGKSTLALALAGLLPAGASISGTIGSPRDLRPGRDIGFVFQDPGSSLNPVLRIGEQIAEVSRRHLGHSWRDAYAHALALIERVRLPDPEKSARAFPHQLSGGQRQRVAIAEAIAAQAQLLIADEATSALDTVVQAGIVSLLDDLVRERGLTLAFITHDIALASGFADRIAVLDHGRLVECGPAAAVIARPEAERTRRLLANHIDLDTRPYIDRVAR